MKDVIHMTLKVAHKLKNKIKPISQSRIVKVPKTGRVLPLIPIFPDYQHLELYMVSRNCNSVNDAKSAKKQLEKSHRHNNSIEAIAMGKTLYLNLYKQGMGLYLNQI